MNTIYKIYCLDSDIKDFYIGSSKKFKKRKMSHKFNCNNENRKSYNIKLYKFIRANGGYNNFDYEILLETIEDNIKILEQEYIKELKPALNCRSACGFDSKEYRKQYKLKNKQKIREKDRLYRLKNKEKQKEKIKEYYQKNKEKIKQYQKQYRLKKKSNRLKKNL